MARRRKTWTKGPWHPGMDPASYASGQPPSVDATPYLSDIVITSAIDACNRRNIARVTRYTDEGPANARLIAAAPELYEALGKSLGELSMVAERAAHEHDEHTLRAVYRAIVAARAALAKAEGR